MEDQEGSAQASNDGLDVRIASELIEQARE